jgi:cation transport ATPase
MNRVSLPSLQILPARPAAGSGSLVELPVAGLRCASSVAHLEKALRAVPGVVEVSVNLATARASVRRRGVSSRRMYRT